MANSVATCEATELCGLGVEPCGVDAAVNAGAATLITVDAAEAGVLVVTLVEPPVPVTVGLVARADVIDGAVTASAWWLTGGTVAAMVSAGCDGATELLGTVGEDGELLGADVSGAEVVPAEMSVDADGPLVADAVALGLLELAEDEPVVDDSPVVALVVVLPPEVVVVVEPVLPPLEDTELDGEG